MKDNFAALHSCFLSEQEYLWLTKAGHQREDIVVIVSLFIKYKIVFL